MRNFLIGEITVRIHEGKLTEEERNKVIKEAAEQLLKATMTGAPKK